MPTVRVSAALCARPPGCGFGLGAAPENDALVGDGPYSMVVTFSDKQEPG
jgi:hypothetical protein